jgi:hypothetical protein
MPRASSSLLIRQPEYYFSSKSQFAGRYLRLTWRDHSVVHLLQSTAMRRAHGHFEGGLGPGNRGTQ